MIEGSCFSDIHGGPTARHKPDFSARDLFFATELNFAMVFPNIRGSSGFGKEVEDLDNGAKGGDAVQDVMALVESYKYQSLFVAVRQGQTRRNQSCL